MHVRFWTLDFQNSLEIPHARWQVINAVWQDFGGPDRAQLHLPEPPPALSAPQDLLRRPLALLDDSGTPCWWGYVQSASLRRAAREWSASLAPLANRVQTLYDRNVPTHEWQLQSDYSTAWAEDGFSQQIYGVKSHQVHLAAANDEQAAAARDAHLAQHAHPAPQTRPAIGAPDGLHLEALGWLHTLDWNEYRQPQGQLGSSLNGDAIFTLGSSGSYYSAAESFQLTSGPWPLEEVWLRIWQWHAPVDNVVVTIRSDASGKPGAAALATASRPGSDLPGGPRWVCFSFSAPFTPQLNTRYWLVVERSAGASSASYYKLSLDEGLGFGEGSFLYRANSTWAARTPDADLLFRLNGRRETSTQMAEIGADVRCGQFLRGVQVETASGMDAPLYHDGSQSGLQCLRTLSAAGDSQGRRLLVSVSAERVLRIFAQTPVERPTLWVTPEGRICAPGGGPLPLSQPPAGQWAWDANGVLYLSAAQICAGEWHVLPTK